MSHTPAPWKWDANPCDYDEEQDAPWLVAPNSAQVVLLGSIKCGSEADARLIASAPELLEALNNIVVITHQNTMSRGAIRDIARQAIYKAEGK